MTMDNDRRLIRAERKLARLRRRQQRDQDIARNNSRSRSDISTIQELPQVLPELPPVNTQRRSRRSSSVVRRANRRSG